MNFNTKAPFHYNTYDNVINPDSKFSLTSKDLKDGDILSEKQLSKRFSVPSGEDESPALEWSGFPSEETKSFVVTCYDIDAPVPSGIWHWCMYDIPANVTSLESDAGNNTEKRPTGAKVLRNDVGFRGYLGAAAPQGHGSHRYIFCVTALPVDKLPAVDEDSSPAWLHVQMKYAVVLGRGFLTGTFGR